jgi:Holliday junction resolvasome RuvABC endonuclease subunit
LSETAAGITVIDDHGVVCYEDTSGFKLSRDEPESARTQRICTIRDACVRPFNRFKIGRVWIEGYAFSRAGSSSVTGLAEVRGAVKTAIFDKFGLVTEAAGPRLVRSKILGKGWGGAKSKKQIRDFLIGHGLTFQNHNTMDAFVVAAYGLLKDTGRIA